MSYLLRIFLVVLIICNTGVNSAIAASEPFFKTIAVPDFKNNTGLISLDNLEKGLADTLTNNLAKFKDITILERSRLKDAISELSLNQTTFVSQDTAIKIGKITGSQYVVLGSVVRVGEIYEVGLRIVDVESSKIVLGKSVRCSNEETILQSVDYLSLEVANSLGVTVDKLVLETARKNAETISPVKTGLAWLFWVGGGVLALAAVSGIIIAVTLGSEKQENNQNVCIGPNCVSKPPANLNFSFNFPLW